MIPSRTVTLSFKNTGLVDLKEADPELCNQQQTLGAL